MPVEKNEVSLEKMPLVNGGWKDASLWTTVAEGKYSSSSLLRVLQRPSWTAARKASFHVEAQQH